LNGSWGNTSTFYLFEPNKAPGLSFHYLLESRKKEEKMKKINKKKLIHWNGEMYELYKDTILIPTTRMVG